MSIFPTKILLATDGSGEAALAAQTAVDLAGCTNSELHIVSVVRGVRTLLMGCMKPVFATKPTKKRPKR